MFKRNIAGRVLLYLFEGPVLCDSIVKKKIKSLQKCMLQTRILTHWGPIYICVSKIIIIGSDNGLSSGRRQAIIWTNARILLNGYWGTNFSEILIEISSFSFEKMHLKMLSGKMVAILSRPQCVNMQHIPRIMHMVCILLSFVFSLAQVQLYNWPGSSDST